MDIQIPAFLPGEKARGREQFPLVAVPAGISVTAFKGRDHYAKDVDARRMVSSAIYACVVHPLALNQIKGLKGQIMFVCTESSTVFILI